ncbi:hypothetical protein Hanom_Chr10g00873991 [Helianthus anomalus]
MHRVADPRDNLTRPSNRSNKVWKFDPHVLGSHSCYDCNPSRLVFRVQDVNELDQLIRVHLVTHL